MLLQATSSGGDQLNRDSAYFRGGSSQLLPLCGLLAECWRRALVLSDPSIPRVYPGWFFVLFLFLYSSTVYVAVRRLLLCLVFRTVLPDCDRAVQSS